MWFFWLFKMTAYWPLRLAWRVRTVGRENLPASPYILVSNHGAPKDPCLINLAIPFKRIHFLTSPRLFDCPRILQWMLRQMGCHCSVSPAADVEHFRQQAGQLGPHELIGYFAEGRLNAGMKSFHSGAVILAMQTGFPIVPLYVDAACSSREKSYVIFGKPVTCDLGPDSSPDDLAGFSEKLREQIIGLSAGRR